MRSRLYLISFLFFCGTCFAQNFNPQKDLAFGQIAAGGGYESVLTVTNRGTAAYSGILELHTTDAGTPWNPTIDGVQVTGGQLDISLSPGETKTYRITLSGNTESAFGFVRSADLSQASYIEGNLTYYVSAEGSTGGDPLPFEGVGVPASSEFFKTTVPFEDVLTVALALANVNTGSANVVLTVFSESNVQLGTKALEIGPNGHFVSFLWQQIGGLTGPGRLEIESDVPVIGTALTFVSSSASPVGSLFSSLPLLPSAYSYTYVATVSGFPIEGEIGMWAEGSFIKGYFRLTRAIIPIDPPETALLHGQLQDGVLQLLGYGTSAILGGGQPFGVFIEVENFDFTASGFSGSFAFSDFKGGAAQQGTVTTTKVF